MCVCVCVCVHGGLCELIIVLDLKEYTVKPVYKDNSWGLKSTNLQGGFCLVKI